MATIDAFFKLMFDHGASDLHLVTGQKPILRLHGEMERIEYKFLPLLKTPPADYYG